MKNLWIRFYNEDEAKAILDFYNVGDVEKVLPPIRASLARYPKSLGILISIGEYAGYYNGHPDGYLEVIPSFLPKLRSLEVIV